MPIPEFITDLREKIGNDLLWLPGVTVLVMREGANPDVPELLVVRRADSGAYTPITGIPDPAEHAHEAAIREAKEEACIDIAIDGVLRVQAIPPVTYSNGHQCCYMDTAFLAHPVDPTQQPRVGDDESTYAAYVPVNQLPEMKPRFSALIEQALDNPHGPCQWSSPA
ncbi:NUDIX hydrolase [Corynebacterium aquilae]|uniref:Nudix hydrolase domain-containing protein n=1 Tax=Corynebacterium aquilae DSM 44791 TaxID=1431546 RepID=A0A1L7CIT8_9CORY|nr:NUDIX domain-containing protein [Corynebacterium aquilae]APT85728.1 hypothetical protein CAQU_12560 [Corynebacterium aquilae DSM 44791]